MRNYPKVPRTDVKDTYFGVTIEDPYRYLEDKKAPEVLDIVAAGERIYKRSLIISLSSIGRRSKSVCAKSRCIMRFPACRRLAAAAVQSQARRRHARHRYAGRKRSGQRRADE